MWLQVECVCVCVRDLLASCAVTRWGTHQEAKASASSSCCSMIVNMIPTCMYVEFTLSL